jgi:membrane-bound metal-dependent hydrolase YbcI (DUF457 family)
MTTVGHSLTGLCIATLTLPPGQSRRWYVLISICFVALANAPDFPLPGWGHNAYHISHSVFVTVLLSCLLALLFYWPTFNVRVGVKVLTAWSIAWLSHLPLDSMYAHGQGIAIFWPLSDAHLAMPVSWFETISLPARSEHNLQVFRIELLAYGTALLSCAGLRWAWSIRKN